MIELLKQYISDPKNAKNNILLGIEYFKIKHYAEAVSFFLRCAENSEGDLRYEALIHLYRCYRELGGRGFTLNSILKHTIALFPNRPEAYYHLAKLCEADNANMDGYMYANLGLDYSKNKSKFLFDSEYQGPQDLLFLKGHFAWLIDKPQESRQIYQYILKNYVHYLPYDTTTYLRKELLNLGMAKEHETIKLYSKDSKNWRLDFNGRESIEKNFSQIFQDMFVLYCLDGKRNGTYLEIGSSYPYHTNNTALLEHQFDWYGIGLDYNAEFVDNYNSHRKNKSIFVDALLLDYSKLIDKYFPDVFHIDYLQIDIQTSEDTYNVLTSIPFDKHKFAVITYEHDDYVDITQQYKQKSREFLLSKGYYLAVPDVSPIDGFSFEDWWIHPDLVDINRIHKFVNYLHDIDWGSLTQIDINTISREIILEKVYSYWKTVKNNDIVMDIGCSVGPFGCSIMNRKLKKLYCIEASKDSIEVAQKNISSKNVNNNEVIFINSAVVKDKNSNNVHVFGDNKEYTTITFKEIIEQNNIDYIDFLKIDIEGSEYDIFIDENIDFLRNNVMFIAVEIHLNYPGNRDKFKIFRDKYLKYFPNHKFLSCTTQDIVPDQSIDLESYLMQDSFVDTYQQQFMLYINNDKSHI